MTVTPAALSAESVSRNLNRRGTDVKGLAFLGLTIACLLAALGMLATLLIRIFSAGAPYLKERGTSFLTNDLSSSTSIVGVRQGIIGTLTIAAIVAIIAFPMGIATAIYLEEYARDSRWMRFVRLNVRNLAGVPSIVYGLLGFALFVKVLGGNGKLRGEGLTGGRTIISAGLTLSLLVLPIVVITASEALRAVPRPLREGGYGIGATRWEVTKTLVLPNAVPGILTGTILALSRAIGETAPLILVGAVGSGFLSTGNQSFFESLRNGGFTALPMLAFGWAKQPGADYREQLAPAAAIVLLGITLLANAVAITLRNRFEKRW